MHTSPRPRSKSRTRRENTKSAYRSEKGSTSVQRPVDAESPPGTDLLHSYLRDLSCYCPPKMDQLVEQELQKLITRGLEAEAELQRGPSEGVRFDPKEQQSLQAEVETALNARQSLVLQHLGLVVGIAKKYKGLGLSLLDLVQEGNIGLMKAADKFDPTKGSFATYCNPWIRGAIIHAIAESHTIRVPVRVTATVTKLRRAKYELEQTLLREPTEEEFGQALNMSADQVRRILAMAYHAASLDVPLERGEDGSLADVIKDETAPSPEEDVLRRLLKKHLEDMLAKLDERKRKILIMRFGLDGDPPRTFGAIAKELGLTRQRIKEIESQSLRELKEGHVVCAAEVTYLDYIA